MTSYRQIEANRRNALRSTGPKTAAGKEASRRNALRHGLTAETVIGALEDAEDYEAFEAAITADYDAQSAVRSRHLIAVIRRSEAVVFGLTAKPKSTANNPTVGELRRVRQVFSSSCRTANMAFRNATGAAV
jgi:hypothetical protein